VFRKGETEEEEEDRVDWYLKLALRDGLCVKAGFQDQRHETYIGRSAGLKEEHLYGWNRLIGLFSLILHRVYLNVTAGGSLEREGQ